MTQQELKRGNEIMKDIARLQRKIIMYTDEGAIKIMNDKIKSLKEEFKKL